MDGKSIEGKNGVRNLMVKVATKRGQEHFNDNDNENDNDEEVDE